MRKRSLYVFLCVLLIISSSSIVGGHSKTYAAAKDPTYYMIPQYEKTWSYSEGLGRIKKDQTLNFVDKQGNIVGTPKVANITSSSKFNQGITIAVQCGMFGCDSLLMNKEGVAITKGYFDLSLWNAENGIYKIIKKSEKIPWDNDRVLNTHALMDKKGQLIKGAEFNYIDDLGNGLYEITKTVISGNKFVHKYGIMNAAGKVLITPKYNHIYEFQDGFAKVEQNNKSGYINEQGVEIIRPIYDAIGLFENGFALVRIGRQGPNPSSAKFGVVDKSGKVILEPIYENITIQNNGLFKIMSYEKRIQYIVDATGKVIHENKDSGYSNYSDGLILSYHYTSNVYIDENGQEVLHVDRDNPGDFIDGIALVNGGTSFIDKTGKEVEELRNVMELLKTKYDSITNFYDGIAAVSKDELHGYIDRSGKEIFAPQFTTSDSVDTFSDDGLLYAIDQNEKQRIISKTGKIYDEFAPNDFYEGMTPVGKSGKWGFVDKMGNEIVKPIYDEVKRFNNGVAHVSKAGKWGAVDSKGNEIIKPAYGEVKPFDNGLAFVSKVGKWGMVDMKGNEIIKPIYDAINPFKEGLASVKRNGLFGYVDSSGKEVITPQFEEAESFIEELASVKIEGRWGYIINPIANSKIKPQSSEIANWAKKDVQTAIDSGLVPLFLRTDYGASITRAEFSALLVRFIELRTGKTIETIIKNKKIKVDTTWESFQFSDTPTGTLGMVNRRPILALEALGIIADKGKNKNGSRMIDPKGKVTQQEAAVMLTKTAALLKMKQAEAQSAVKAAEGKRLAPQNLYTRQQAIVTILRLSQVK